MKLMNVECPIEKGMGCFNPVGFVFYIIFFYFYFLHLINGNACIKVL